MKNSKTNYQWKTEFLFESDAEKAVLMEAARPKKPKLHKRIIKLAVFISIFFILTITILNHYKTKEINKITASLIQINGNKTISELMNKYSDNLEVINNNYDSKYEIIVNKANKIDETIVNNYTMVNINNNLYKGLKLEKQTYESYLKLKENLKQKGYNINIKNAFRTFNETNALYNIYSFKKGEDYAEKYIDKAGESEHNIGLSFDFILLDKKNNEIKENSSEYEYLKSISYLYGFIIRYPKDKEQITGYSYDAWHLRYVGIELAKYLTKNNLTLEEYYK